MAPTSPSLAVVIVIDHAEVTGGQAKVAFDSAIGLKRAGHRPIVFAASGPIDPGLTAAGVEVVCLGQSDLVHNPSKLAAAVQGIWNGAAARGLAAVLQSLPRQRSVVHVHGWAKALSPAIAAPIRASGLPALYTLHEYFLVCPNGGFFNYPAQHQCGLDPLSARCWLTSCDARSYARKLWRSTRQVLMNNVLQFSELFADIICISDFQIAKMGHYLPPAARIHRIDNPISATPLGHKSDPAKGPIIFAGRISPEKGPFLFAEAAHRAGIAPVFVGDGPAAAALQARYPNAVVLGWQGAEDTRRHLRAASALVFSSLWYEGQPLIVQEAKSLGTPVVVSDGCAGREAITDGVDGLWFRSNDPDDLAGALARFRAADIAALSRAAYDGFWNDPPTIDRHVDAITRLYAQTLGLKVQEVALV